MILAAGVLCWRGIGPQAEVLLVNRPKRDDWSFPKGKTEPGELLAATATRELEEETGLRCPLGPYVSQVEYEVHGNRPKRVHYWSAQIDEAQWAAAEDRFQSSKEISSRQWMPWRVAFERLTYPRDRALLAQMVACPLLRERLRFTELVVLRHAKAVSRGDWTGDDADRPLTGRGMAQSAALADWLAPWGPTEIVTSPWTRCRQTVAPRAQALGTDPEVLESLSEDRYAADPLRTEREIAERVTAGRSTLFCSHRPVLPAVLSTIGGRVGEAARGRLLPHAGMVVGGFAVLQLGQRADGSWLLLSHELHEPEQEN